MRLTDTSILDELEKPELVQVRQAFTTRVHPKGALVFAPRETKNTIFIVRRGRARVYLASKDKELTLAILDAGDVFSTHTRAYVQALDELEILQADTDMVRRHLGRVPALTMAMVKVLGDLLSHAVSIIDNLAFKDVRTRLIQFLLYEASHSPRAQGPTLCFMSDLNVEQVATIVGSTRQTVSLLLNSLKREGLIQTHGRGVICIPDLTKLESAAD